MNSWFIKELPTGKFLVKSNRSGKTTIAKDMEAVAKVLIKDKNDEDDREKDN